ncbi:hypothetical protein [uncultured Lacinutrix sp.]|uniref:hypothetical protein n=1 Tax=uncultured Lacinutrix sp. TaxID=574032 RepID=UPI00262BF214|nr:hypothetical protein [uncultured Lacinutrix sp.]
MILLITTYQDFVSRSIHVALPVIVFIIALVLNYLSLNLTIYDTLYNVLFITINIISLVLYFSIKSKQLTNPIDNAIGIGDIVLFFAITPLFKTTSFILFFIISLLLTLIIHNVINLFKDVKTIPLAGYLAGFLAGFLAINIIIKNVFKINILFNG